MGNPNPLVQDKLDALFPRPTKRGWGAVKAIHTRCLTELKPLPADPRNPNPAAALLETHPIHWRSVEWSVLCLATPILVDAPTMAVTAMRLGLEAGIEPARLGLALVAEKTRAHLGFSHVVATFWDGAQWRVIADGCQRLYQANHTPALKEVYHPLMIGRCGGRDLDPAFVWMRTGPMPEAAKASVPPRLCYRSVPELLQARAA